MPETTPKMGLAAWDQPLDPYNYQQFANNWNIVDFHDHTPGRGVQIPYGGIAPGAVGVAQLTSDVPLLVTGAIVLWPATGIPTGWLACDGTAYQQSAYSALYSVVGATYNNSPPVGYFNVPLITLGLPTYGHLTWIIKT